MSCNATGALTVFVGTSAFFGSIVVVEVIAGFAKKLIRLLCPVVRDDAHGNGALSPPFFVEEEDNEEVDFTSAGGFLEREACSGAGGAVRFNVAALTKVAVDTEKAF